MNNEIAMQTKNASNFYFAAFYIDPIAKQERQQLTSFEPNEDRFNSNVEFLIQLTANKFIDSLLKHEKGMRHKMN